MPVKADLVVQHGTDWAARVTVSEANGTLIQNFSAYSASVRFAYRLGGTATLELTTENGGVVREPGSLAIVMTPAQTRLVLHGVWQMFVTGPTGRTSVVYEGNVSVTREVLRAE